MLLVIDVGNTNITLGVFNKDELFGTFRMKTKQPRTSDEYGITLQELVERHGIESSKINAVIIASVVPDVMHSLGSAIIKYFGVKPVVVSAGIKTGIRIVTENPRQVGPDRIVDAVGAYTLYGGPTIVVDFGTATTFDVIGPDGTFEAGVIAPGIRTSAQSLRLQNYSFFIFPTQILIRYFRFSILFSYLCVLLCVMTIITTNNNKIFQLKCKVKVLLNYSQSFWRLRVFTSSPSRSRRGA